MAVKFVVPLKMTYKIAYNKSLIFLQISAWDSLKAVVFLTGP